MSVNFIEIEQDEDFQLQDHPETSSGGWERYVGVLTMPDVVPEDVRESAIEVVNNMTVVRNRSLSLLDEG